MWFCIQSKVTVVALWFVLVFPLAWVRGPWEPENEVMSVKFSSAFSLFRRGVYFTFQSPLLFPTHSSFSRAKLRRRRSNTGDQKPAALRIFATGWTELRGEAGHGSSARALSNTNTLLLVQLIKSFLLLVKCIFIMCVCKLIVKSCQGCKVFIFMEAHSVTSPCLFMHVGKIIHGLFGVCHSH